MSAMVSTAFRVGRGCVRADWPKTGASVPIPWQITGKDNRHSNALGYLGQVV